MRAGWIRDGVKAVGRVEERKRTGQTFAPFEVSYVVVVDGRDYHGASRVERSVFDGATRGQPLTIEYLRSDPAVSRIAHSISRGRAEDTLRLSNAGFARLALCALMLIGATVYSRRKSGGI